MNDFRIEFSNESAVYLPGQTVTGRIVIHNREPIKASWLKICIHGSADTHWSEYERCSRMDREGKLESYNEHVHYSSKINYLEGETMAWTANQKNKVLAAGLNIFPFAFALPPNLPPSFEGFHGCIRYSVHVELDRPWRFNKKSKKCFSVVPVFDLNMMPIVGQPMIQSKSKNIGLLFKKGLLNVTVTMPKQGFVPGENVNLIINLENTSKKEIQIARAKIMQNSKYFARRGVSGTLFDPNTTQYRNNHNEKHDSKMIGESRKFINIAPMTTSQCTLSLRIPATVPTFNNCPIISVDYCLHLAVDANSTFGNSVKLEFPLVIGTVPLNSPPMVAAIPPQSSHYPSAPPIPSDGPSHYPTVSPSAPPYPEQDNSDAPPSYQDVAAALPPSYEQSMSGNATKNADDFEPFAPRYPVFNNLPQAPPLPEKI